jgi:hypothetical protein
MRLAGHFMVGLAVLGGFAMAVQADDLAVASNPYSTITERNVFALVPIPPPPDPSTLVAPADPPPKITIQGMMTLFGKPQVLFKFTLKAPAGQQPKEESFVLSEGERQEDVEVTKIDMVGKTASFINHGIAQDVALSDTAKLTGPAPSPVMGGMPSPAVGGIPLPSGGNGGMPMMGGMRGRGVMGTRPGSDGSNPGVGAAGPGGVIPQSNDPANASDNLTAEERAILIEAQRGVLKQQNNPAAAILPPTSRILPPDIIKGLNGESDGAMTPGSR